MKNSKKLFLAILLCVLMVLSVVLAACNKPYTLTFVTNGGSPVERIPFSKGQKITPPQTSKAYFTFQGWYADEQLQTPFEQFNKMPDHDVTVYAKWKAGETGKIVFVTNGGSSVDAITGTVGQTVNMPANPVKAGYSFGGWYRDEGCTSLYIPGTMQSGTLTLYAKWNRDGSYHYVTYVVNDTTTEIAVQHGNTAVEPPLAQGVVCDWYTDVNFTNKYNFNLPVNENKTLYGLKYSQGLVVSGGKVTAYNGNSSEVFVPEKYGNDTVTTIGAGAFSSNNAINYVSLPDSVTTVEQTAFYKCEYLINVNVYKCVGSLGTSKITTIGNLAFANCVRMLSAVDLSGVTALSEGAFANCSFLEDVTLGNSLVEIGANVFINCKALTNLQLPSSVQSLGNYALANSGITSLTIPASLNSWGTGVVKGCQALATIEGGNQDFVVSGGTLINGDTLLLYFNKTLSDYALPNGVEHVAPYAFYGNTTLHSLDVSACNGQALTKSSLEGLKSLQTLTVKDLDSGSSYLAYWFGASTKEANSANGQYVPKSLSKVTFTEYSASNVPAYAFYGCNGLATIEGIDVINSIGEYAYGYTAIESYHVAANTTNVAQTAFYGTSKLQQITVDLANNTYSSYEDALYDKSVNTLLYAPEKMTQITFADSITSIGAGAMYRSQVTELTVPSYVVSIGLGAFENMTNLRSLTVPFIGGGSANNQYMLYVFGATIEDAEDDSEGKVITAQKCPGSLNTITISGGVSAVPEYAFAYCTTVSQINCGNDYTSIGQFAYYSTALKSIVVPDTVKTIGDYAFYKCQDAKTLVVGSGVTSIGKWAFANTTELERVEFREGQNDLVIGDYAFHATVTTETSPEDGTEYVDAAYSQLSELILSNNIISIGREAFRFAGYYGDLGNASAYNYFNVHFNVQDSRLKNIGESAFLCSAVNTVILPNSIESVGAHAFALCDVLGSITLRKQVADVSEVPTLGTEVLLGSPYARVYVPKDCLEIYQSAWSQLELGNLIQAIKEA